jgi:RNAse (barnase) inhibitor barstar
VIENELKQVPQDAALLVVETDTGTADDAALRWRRAGLTVLVVRGRKMRKTAALFDEFAAALQFPSYFGENWNAFDECVSETDWMPLGDGFVLIVNDADQVLIDADEDDTLDVLVGTFALAFENYAAPIAQGAWFDRPPVPFHVVLQVEPTVVPATHARWLAAGAKLRVVDLATGVSARRTTIRFTAAQYDYMLEPGDLLPGPVRGRLEALGGPANGRERTLELDDDLLVALRDALTERFDAIGLDEAYELTRAGAVLDELIGTLVPE